MRYKHLYKKIGKGDLTLYQNDKILEATELKPFSDDKLNVARMMFSLVDRVETRKHCGKKEKMLVTCIFSFPTVFPKPSSLGSSNKTSFAPLESWSLFGIGKKKLQRGKNITRYLPKRKKK